MLEAFLSHPGALAAWGLNRLLYGECREWVPSSLCALSFPWAPQSSKGSRQVVLTPLKSPCPRSTLLSSALGAHYPPTDPPLGSSGDLWAAGPVLDSARKAWEKCPSSSCL